MFDQSQDVRAQAIQIFDVLKQKNSLQNRPDLIQKLEGLKNQLFLQLVSIGSKEKHFYIPVLELLDNFNLLSKEDFVKVGNLSILHLNKEDNKIGDFLKGKFNFDK